MTEPHENDEETPLHAVGRVLDSRWMMAFSVLAVLVAIAWALTTSGPAEERAGESATPMATVELLGVPAGSQVFLDGRKIDNTFFGVSTGTRHALEVTDARGRSWRQVFLADGSVSLVVELRTHFAEIEVSPSDQEPGKH